MALMPRIARGSSHFAFSGSLAFLVASGNDSSLPGAASPGSFPLHAFSILIPVPRISASPHPGPVRFLSGISGIHHIQAPYIAGIVRPIPSDLLIAGKPIQVQYRFG